MKYLVLIAIILAGCGAKPSPEAQYFCWKGTLYNTDSGTPVYEKKTQTGFMLSKHAYKKASHDTNNYRKAGSFNKNPSI